MTSRHVGRVSVACVRVAIELLGVCPEDSGRSELLILSSRNDAFVVGFRCRGNNKMSRKNIDDHFAAIPERSRLIGRGM
jgi:hypothetical protein